MAFIVVKALIQEQAKQETLEVQPKNHLYRVCFAVRYGSAGLSGSSSHVSKIHFAAPL